jgi:peptide/nickel transport system permease protein
VARFLVRRLCWAVFLFLVATLVTFLIFFVIPSNRAGHKATYAAPPGFVKHLHHVLHLDVPLYQQYWMFVWNIVRHLSLGYSFNNGASVRWVIGQDAPVTASLVLGGAVLWLLVSIPLGVASALRPRSLLDRAGTIFALVGVSAPAFWIGLILAYAVGFKLGWTPIANYCNFFPSHQVGVCSGPGQWAYHLILPWLTFMLIFAALYVRLVRANVLATLGEDYVRTARAKGVSTRRLLVHHVLRNSLLPILTILGMDLGLAVGSAIFTETVFGLPGLGQELVTASLNDDRSLVVGIVVVVTIAVIVFNVLVDVAYGWLDPRIRLVERAPGEAA